MKFIDKSNYREIWENDWLKHEVSRTRLNNFMFVIVAVVELAMTFNYKVEVIRQAWTFYWNRGMSK